MSSMVAYARDGDNLVASTPGTTFKTASIACDPHVSLCVIANAEPFNFANVEGRCGVERDDLERRTRLVFENIAATGCEEPEDLSVWLASQQRVILRISPTRIHAVIR
ncbi:MAG: hypothetical protein QGI55_09690 [Pseudomonadales bacterium]|nr:hypothetical protein [Pseudomonadales bacterium]